EAGFLVFPRPEDPEMIQKEQEGTCPNFYLYERLPLWDEEYLIKRIRRLRELGLKNVYFKMAGYDLRDLKRVLFLGSQAEVDLITFDGAGGGSGYSPNKMMNEWGLPTVVLEEAVCALSRELRLKKQYVPALAITGGFSTEDQVFKALAYGQGAITAVGLGRAAMAAAMAGRRIGRLIEEGRIPQALSRHGRTAAELFADLPDLRALYGREANSFPLGAVGVFSYLNKIAFGLKHFAALNRKFDLSYLNQNDLIPLTGEARDLIRGRWFL
ncbi:MAG: FMN-binding glutamate synthase family protein, partial [Firmicutes bacterium]|nr:FMN-binding glutamate synthase family protein [Bacillota bacterium]